MSDLPKPEAVPPVRLTVSKPGMEVVNTKEIEQVIIGRIPRMNVVMADPDKRVRDRAIAMSEPGAGSDLQGVRTTALVVPTNEELLIAQDTFAIVSGLVPS